MSGFLHHFARRSLGLAPQVKSRAALPYAPPAPEPDSPAPHGIDTRPADVPAMPGQPAITHQAPDHPRELDRLPSLVPPRRKADAIDKPDSHDRPPAPPSPVAVAPTPPQHRAAPPEPRVERAAGHVTPIVTTQAPAPQSAQPRRQSPAATPVLDDASGAPLADIESLVSRLLGEQARPLASEPDAAPVTAETMPKPYPLRPATATPTTPPPRSESPTATPEADSTPEVHITIGRLEVNPPSRPAPVAPPPRPRGPAPLSLSDYLARRNGGRS
ncbi:MAG: hypothetical protein H6R14_1434 [Proteobacteria bacterium]|nr:hypothetical protein [Pseudomonadota bacterium]